MNSKSEGWDYKKQQEEVMIRFWLYKLREAYKDTLSSLTKADEEVRVLRAKLGKEYTNQSQDTIKNMQYQINKTDEMLAKTNPILDEELWENSLSCIGCTQSFKNYDHLLQHLAIHLEKLGVFPKGKFRKKK